MDYHGRVGLSTPNRSNPSTNVGRPWQARIERWRRLVPAALRLTAYRRPPRGGGRNPVRPAERVAVLP